MQIKYKYPSAISKSLFFYIYASLVLTLVFCFLVNPVLGEQPPSQDESQPIKPEFTPQSCIEAKRVCLMDVAGGVYEAVEQIDGSVAPSVNKLMCAKDILLELGIIAVDLCITPRELVDLWPTILNSGAEVACSIISCFPFGPTYAYLEPWLTSARLTCMAGEILSPIILCETLKFQCEWEKKVGQPLDPNLFECLLPTTTVRACEPNGSARESYEFHSDCEEAVLEQWENSGLITTADAFPQIIQACKNQCFYHTVQASVGCPNNEYPNVPMLCSPTVAGTSSGVENSDKQLD